MTLPARLQNIEKQVGKVVICKRVTRENKICCDKHLYDLKMGASFLFLYVIVPCLDKKSKENSYAGFSNPIILWIDIPSHSRQLLVYIFSIIHIVNELELI